jgi:hypothetical protein
MSAVWESAPIELVIEAFRTISHRRITTAPNVTGLITSTVIDQPWPQALEAVMARIGLHVEFLADSSIYIAPRQEKRPRSAETEHGFQLSRIVTGLVEDAQTGTPIPDARINVAGVQLLGGPNEVASDKVGRFSLRVADGEVWLDACAPGYAFRRVTLAPTTTVAVFQGTRETKPSSSEAAQLDDLAAISSKADWRMLTYGLQVTAKNGTVMRIPIATSGVAPVLVIDGAVVNNYGVHNCGSRPH